MGIKHILAVMNAATLDERLEGLAWYETARNLAIELDPLDPRLGAGVIAALSPRQSWDTNKWAAVRAYSQGFADIGTGPNIRKANAILEGSDPLEVLGGNKVRAFFACISDPESNEVCIDRHALAVWLGYVPADEHEAANYLARKGRYQAIAEDYRRAARVLGLRPYQVQAITWVAWRRMKASAPSRALDIR